jgi:hypothetical protein
MLCFNRFLAILMTIVMVGPMLPLEAKTRKGDKYLAEGRAHEDKKNGTPLSRITKKRSPRILAT